MSAAYSVLYGFHAIATVLVGLGLLGSLLGLGKTRGLKFREAVFALLLFAFLAGVWYGVWWLQQKGQVGLALAALAVVWSLALLALLYAATRPRRR